MNKFFAYIRVSTARQGEQGVSLQEQREAINRHAQRNGFEILEWFEEQETAAKRGRPVFGRMIKGLRKRTVRGVIIHKIDRSARNLKDWADLGELIDAGVEVHFANEGLDLTSRGGRLSADIQAVVASDYIRNLREETKKGFYGRLKQGILPMPAPLGYRNVGPGQPKEPDPTTAPLVQHLFELYSSGQINCRSLGQEAERIGLRGRSGKSITKNGLSTFLNNPFYAGIIRIAKTGETFLGAHQPLITKALFDRVQDVLKGRTNARTIRHDFLFRRRLKCGPCGHTLIGETHKGFIYYRCQTRECPVTAIREEFADSAILESFAALSLHTDEQRYFTDEIRVLRRDEGQEQEKVVAALELNLKHVADRLSRLTDAYIDRVLDKDSFEERKAALLSERCTLDDSLAAWRLGKRNPADELQQILERADTAYLAHKQGTLWEKRDLVDTLTSNRLVEHKSIAITLDSPFDEIANRSKLAHGSPRRDTARTRKQFLQTLLQVIRNKDSKCDSD